MPLFGKSNDQKRRYPKSRRKLCKGVAWLVFTVAFSLAWLLFYTKASPRHTKIQLFESSSPLSFKNTSTQKESAVAPTGSTLALAFDDFIFGVLFIKKSILCSRRQLPPINGYEPWIPHSSDRLMSERTWKAYHHSATRKSLSNTAACKWIKSYENSNTRFENPTRVIALYAPRAGQLIPHVLSFVMETTNCSREAASMITTVDYFGGRSSGVESSMLAKRATTWIRSEIESYCQAREVLSNFREVPPIHIIIGLGKYSSDDQVLMAVDDLAGSKGPSAPRNMFPFINDVFKICRSHEYSIVEAPQLLPLALGGDIFIIALFPSRLPSKNTAPQTIRVGERPALLPTLAFGLPPQLFLSVAFGHGKGDQWLNYLGELITNGTALGMPINETLAKGIPSFGVEWSPTRHKQPLQISPKRPLSVAESIEDVALKLLSDVGCSPEVSTYPSLIPGLFLNCPYQRVIHWNGRANEDPNIFVSVLGSEESYYLIHRILSRSRHKEIIFGMLVLPRTRHDQPFQFERWLRATRSALQCPTKVVVQFCRSWVESNDDEPPHEYDDALTLPDLLEVVDVGDEHLPTTATQVMNSVVLKLLEQPNSVSRLLAALASAGSDERKHLQPRVRGAVTKALRQYMFQQPLKDLREFILHLSLEQTSIAIRTANFAHSSKAFAWPTVRNFFDPDFIFTTDNLFWEYRSRVNSSEDVLLVSGTGASSLMANLNATGGTVDNDVGYETRLRREDGSFARTAMEQIASLQAKLVKHVGIPIRVPRIAYRKENNNALRDIRLQFVNDTSDPNDDLSHSGSAVTILHYPWVRDNLYHQHNDNIYPILMANEIVKATTGAKQLVPQLVLLPSKRKEMPLPSFQFIAEGLFGNVTDLADGSLHHKGMGLFSFGRPPRPFAADLSVVSTYKAADIVRQVRRSVLRNHVGNSTSNKIGVTVIVRKGSREFYSDGALLAIINNNPPHCDSTLPPSQVEIRLCCEGLTYASQVQLMFNTDILIGTHGAGLFHVSNLDPDRRPIVLHIASHRLPYHEQNIIERLVLLSRRGSSRIEYLISSTLVPFGPLGIKWQDSFDMPADEVEHLWERVVDTYCTLK